MRRLTLLLVTLLIVLTSTVWAAPAAPRRNAPDLYISGSVKDKITGRELLDAHVILFNAAGEPVDTVDCRAKFITSRNGEIEEIELCRFSLPVDRSAGLVTFDVVCDGYNTLTLSKDLSGIHKRETNISLPPVMLERAPRKLSEVTVTASKIKFYHKGDTLVYNADAFQLSEGSMLDELVAQLPGVELKEGGAIYVNGEYVESLLLNGRNFFKGNNTVMLENIGAYTVKNIEVYRGQTDQEKWADDPTVEKHLTMDVKLKKEYMNGYLANIQGGYGTDGRYLGRMFTSLFTPTLNMQLIGQLNNVSDTRKPGKNDSWTPESMPTGTLRRQMLGFNYNYKSKNDKLSAEGHANFEGERPDRRTSSYITNFLPGGDTYEYRFGVNHTRNLKFDTRNTATYYTKRLMLFGMATARWSRRNTMNDNASASFRAEQDSMSRAAIEAIYSDGSPERLEAIINRSISRTDGVRTSAEFQGFVDAHYKLPTPGHTLTAETGFKYRTDREHSFDDYLINYGSDPVPATRRRNFTDVSPNHTLTLINNLGYSFRISRARFNLNYEFRHIDTRKNSALYELDRLADMGIYGVLPAGWADAYDASNSYLSRTQENKNTFEARIQYPITRPGWELIIIAAPSVAIHHRHLDYWSDSRDYQVSHTDVVPTFQAGRTSIYFNWGERQQSMTAPRPHQLRYELAIETRLPDLLHMVDVINDANPLNINLGNPSLKPSVNINHSLSWKWAPQKWYANNTIAVHYATTARDLVRGYTYNTATGVRTNRTYNVDGARAISASNNFNRQFGNRQQFSIESATEASTARSVDMIGVNLEEPSRSSVRSRVLGQSLKFSWQIGRQSLSLFGRVNQRHTTSSRPDFSTINAEHYRYGISGVFSLPGALSLSTGLTVYTRHGYGVSELDTTSKIWDLRLSRAFDKGRWVIAADAFDLLHELSNVSYAVNAQGRTVVYTNTLPRYMMFSVQYRFNHNPRKISDRKLRMAF